MLRKLIKHEFRATGRVMLPLYLVTLVTAVGANFSTRGLLETDNPVLDMLGGLLVIAFVLAIVGICAAAFVLMVQRFYKNLLGDEGYLMFTLPVSVHQQVWAKIIVSTVWFILTGVAVMVSFGIVAYHVGMVQDFFQFCGQLLEALRRLEAYQALNGAAVTVEFCVMMLVGCGAMCLQIYAALAIGHSFANHKMLLSVVFFFGMQFALQMLASAAIIALDEWHVLEFVANWHLQGAAAVHAGMAVVIVGEVLYGAIFYVITTLFLKRRLNLE